MKFAEAAKAIIPFGKHRGRTIDAVASDDDGLRYLDWMIGECTIYDPTFREALETYLADPAIAMEVAAL